MSDQAALTMSALSVLNKWFVDDYNLWKLVERKARKFILSQCGGMNKKAVEKAIDEMNDCYSPYI